MKFLFPIFDCQSVNLLNVKSNGSVHFNFVLLCCVDPVTKWRAFWNSTSSSVPRYEERWLVSKRLGMLSSDTRIETGFNKCQSGSVRVKEIKRKSLQTGDDFMMVWRPMVGGCSPLCTVHLDRPAWYPGSYTGSYWQANTVTTSQTTNTQT